jgi:hypothetical protein
LVAVAGFLGLMLGRFWDNRSEASRWRRDQKTASCQRLAEAFILLYEDIRSIALAEPDTEVSSEAIDRARRDKSWDNALVAVWLHGSTPIVAASMMMDHEVTRLFYDAQARLYSIEEWNEARKSSAGACERFISTARTELDLSPVSVKLFPHSPTE